MIVCYYTKKVEIVMEYNFKKTVNLFMIFDILGDTERTGPH